MRKRLWRTERRLRSFSTFSFVGGVVVKMKKTEFVEDILCVDCKIVVVRVKRFNLLHAVVITKSHEVRCPECSRLKPTY